MENEIEVHGGNKRLALLIAVLALCLAVIETGAKSAQTLALVSNVETSNLWAFYQAKTIRQTAVQTAVEQTELLRPTLDPAQVTALDAQQKAWRDTATRWESEPSTGEGKVELRDRATAADHMRELAMGQYHLLEFAAGALQVAIVVVSASIVTGVMALSWLGVLLGAAGVALGVIGYWMPALLHV